MATIEIADNDARVQYTQAVTANSTTLTIDFPFFDLDDIEVIVTTSAGVDTTLTRGTGTGTFAVNGTAVDDGFSGGNVTLGDTYDDTHTYTIFRDITIQRTTDFPTSGPFNIASLNTELDKLTAITQQNNNNFGRAIKLTDSDATASLTIPNATTRPNKYLGFDGSGNLAALSGTGATIGTIQTANLADALITTAKLADSSVTSAKIVDGTIATADIADDAITNAKMADDSVGANELIDNSVGADAINISGNGSSGQAIVSDADGSFSYKTLANQAFQGTTGTVVGAGLTERTSVNITPTSTSAKILILASMFDNINSTEVDIEIQRDSTVLTGSLRQASFQEIKGDGGSLSRLNSLATFWLDEPNTTSQINYKLMSDVACDNANIIAIEISS